MVPDADRGLERVGYGAGEMSLAWEEKAGNWTYFKFCTCKQTHEKMEGSMPGTSL